VICLVIMAPGPDGPPVVLVHDTCGNVTQPVLTCPHCNGEVAAANTHREPGPGSRPAPGRAVTDGGGAVS
jgi:hypothetical protein